MSNEHQNKCTINIVFNDLSFATYKDSLFRWQVLVYRQDILGSPTDADKNRPTP